MINNNISKNKLALLLFPWKNLGKEILPLYLKKDYEVILFVLLEEDRDFYQATFKEKRKVQVIKIDTPIQLFWEQLPSSLLKKIAEPLIVINFIGKDLLKMHVDGDGMDWNIKLDEPTQIRFDFIDNILKEFSKKTRCVWINLVHGMGGQSYKEDIFCSTRYGIIGTSNVMKMNPLLSKIEIVNICLTFLKHKAHANMVEHCSNCVTEKFEGELVNVKSEEDFADFLTNKSLQLLSSKGEQN